MNDASVSEVDRLRRRVRDLERLLETDRRAGLREIRSAAAAVPEPAPAESAPPSLEDLPEHVRRAVEAARAKARAEAQNGVDVAFYPDFRGGNPYQEMLFSGARAAGLGVAPLPWAPESLVHEKADPDRGYVVNLHWTAPVLQTSEHSAEAVRRLDHFTAMLDELAERGGRLLWTVHNVLPHECPYRLLEIELCRRLAERADLVHVMDDSTVEAVRDLYPLDPAKVRVVPHASYQGVYPDTATRAEARERHGLGEDETAVLVLGGLRRYKAPERLLEAFEQAAARHPGLRLLIAGEPDGDPELGPFVERCESDPRIVCHFGRVADDDLQWWLRAADLAALPYANVLNSGFLHLATGYGLPVVAPDVPGLRNILEPAWSQSFPPEADAPVLAEALLAGAERLGNAEARAAAAARGASYPPEAMADEFLTLLTSLGVKPA